MSTTAGNTQSAEEIRRDIERTRERLGDTVEALGAQLNPSHLKQRVKDSVREATIGKVKNMANNARDRAEASGRGVIATVRNNPIPAAMIAGGIGWLLFSRRRDAKEPQSFEYDNSTFERGYASEAEGSIDSSRLLPETPDEGVTSRVASTAKSAGDKVVSGARNAGERVASTARTASERVATGASTVAHDVADRARASGQRIGETYEQNPVALGVIAAAVGLAVGMTIPASEAESRLMGAKRDELIDKARDVVDDTKEKVRHVAERAVPEMGATIKDVARQEGLAG